MSPVAPILFTSLVLSVKSGETMVKLYKCPHCKKSLRPLRLPKLTGRSREYREWSGIWYCMNCHALVLVAGELHPAPIFVYGDTDWLEK